MVSEGGRRIHRMFRDLFFKNTKIKRPQTENCHEKLKIFRDIVALHGSNIEVRT